MISYDYEVAPWCPSNWHEPENVQAFPGLEAVTEVTDQIALAAAIQEHLPKDRNSWAQLPEELANAAWDNDGRTVAAWNVTGPRGTYQVRLARTVST